MSTDRNLPLGSPRHQDVTSSNLGHAQNWKVWRHNYETGPPVRPCRLPVHFTEPSKSTVTTSQTGTGPLPLIRLNEWMNDNL